MILGKYTKQPADIKDYLVNYSDWLSENQGGDTLFRVEATVACMTTATDTSLLITNLSGSTSAIAVWLSGGTNGNMYKVTITITTTAGRVDQSELLIKVKDY